MKTKKGKETLLVCFSLVAKPRVCFCRREVSWALLLACILTLKSLNTHTHTPSCRLLYHMWIKGNRTEATFPEKSWPRAAQSRDWKEQSARRERECPCRFYLPPPPSLFSSQDLKAGPHARHCTLFPGEHFSFPHHRHEKLWPSCLGKRPEGLLARSVRKFKKKKKKVGANSRGVCLRGGWL